MGEASGGLAMELGGDDSDDQPGSIPAGETGDGNTSTNRWHAPPTLLEAQSALADVSAILSPKRKSGPGHNPFDGDDLLRSRLHMVKVMFWTFIDKSEPTTWIAASLKTAHTFQRSTHTAKQLRKWARSFIEDRDDLPINLYGSWNVSLLEKGELAQEIKLHLQEKGKWVKAMDIVHFLDTLEIKVRLNL